MTADTLLICEGGDDELTLRALLPGNMRERTEIKCAGGQDQLRPLLRTLGQFTEITSGQFRTVAIVRDAEAIAGASLQSTLDALQEGGVPNLPIASGEIAAGSPNLGVFIVGKSDGTGMLEDLFLESIAGRPDFSCLESYFECVRATGARWPTNVAKAKLRAWLAMEADRDLRAGLAVKRGLIDANHAAFDGLRQFLQSVAAL